jgi:signal transduction histidine kinase
MIALTASTVVPSAALAFKPELESYDVMNPIGAGGAIGRALAEGSDATLIVLLIAMGAGATAAVARFRRSVGDERQQLKWLALSAAVLAVALLVFGVLAIATAGTSNPEDVDWAENLIVASFLAVPISVGFGVLKYRLYDVDVVINRAVVYGGLAAFISIVYVGFVVGIGALVGSRGNAVLSAVAAAVVALAFQPARRRAQHLANRLVYGPRATPYEVLSALSERFASTFSLDDALPRLARVTGEAVGATRTRVWLHRDGALHVTTSWPDAAHHTEVLPVLGGEVPEVPEDAMFPVRHAGMLLGAISVTMPPTEPMSAPQDKLLRDVAAQAALVLRNVSLVEDLRASRKRIVTAQDERAKHLERNIHDGAQQELVALAIQLRLLRRLVTDDPAAADERLVELEGRTRETLENLRDLARGIYPPLLADEGLAAALASQARRSPVAVELSADGLERYGEEVESAVYFCVLEALQNVAKYAATDAATVRLRHADGTLTFEVADRGTGFDAVNARRGAGLQNMADRLAAIGGELDVRSSPGGGTVVTGSIRP